MVKNRFITIIIVLMILITIDIELFIIYNNSVQIYINDMFAKKPLALKRLNIALNCMGVVWIDSLPTKLVEIVYYKRKLSWN